MTGSLSVSLRRFWMEHGLDADAKVLVAVSGGLDSCVLLHLLRFGDVSRPAVVVGHFDHAMRRDSAADASWVRGLCRAWDVRCSVERAEEPPRSEVEARDLRYAFLDRVARREGVDALLTAHHADDQAETVLFRVLRGTGIAGLGGIPSAREGRVLRPLLDRWRAELEEYARRVGLAWREDATNDAVGPARNVIRHRIIPEVEASFAPGARRALVRLARIASAEEEAWDEVVPGLLDDVEVERDATGVSVRRDRLLALHPALRARVLRSLAVELGAVLDESGTMRAMEFARTGRSGGGIEIGEGVELRRRLDRLALVAADPVGPDRTVTIPDGGPGRATARLAGRAVEVRWAKDVAPAPGVEVLETSVDRLPLLVRGPAPGDRMRLTAGTKKLTKLLLDARVPADLRGRVPVVVDVHGSVLWMPGIARSTDARAEPGGSTVTIAIET